jgi:putative CocE/NonD family hydrolase
MGPWSHGGSFLLDGRKLGDVDFGSDTALYYRTNVRLPFFEYYLKGKGQKPPIIEAFETGTNVWRQYADWPPPGTRDATLYLQERGALSFAAPEVDSAFDEYVSDPAKPVPFMGDVPRPSARLVPPEYMTADQRFAGRRPDVLLYQTDRLEEDLTVAGSVSPKLFVSTSGTDADWIVKLIDVYPSNFPGSRTNVVSANSDVDDVLPAGQSMGGYQQLVRGEPIRGKFRHGWERPAPIAPGRVEAVSFTMADINHTFRRGHRIMIQVQSTWFPLIDLNPQTFVNIPDATPEDFQKATQRVYRSREYPSAIVLQTLPPIPASNMPVRH